jgi:hypothetical protein
MVTPERGTFVPLRTLQRAKVSLALASRIYPAHVRQCAKVFWFFFSKKNILACLKNVGGTDPAFPPAHDANVIGRAYAAKPTGP